ncbi:MAG: DUF2202 domain-containing protein [Dehalococcoidia bacterium]
MKIRNIALLLGGAVALMFGMVACGDDDDDGGNVQPSATATSATTPSATSSSTDAVKSALLESINEEYKAHATYQAVIDKLGNVAPFSNIVVSEQSHIDAWKTLLTKYEIAIPDDPFLGKVTAPATKAEACTAGVAAEKEDVALYDRLMATVSEPDILAVMQQQRKVSQENHLPAFERC